MAKLSSYQKQLQKLIENYVEKRTDNPTVIRKVKERLGNATEINQIIITDDKGYVNLDTIISQELSTDENLIRDLLTELDIEFKTRHPQGEWEFVFDLNGSSVAISSSLEFNEKYALYFDDNRVCVTLNQLKSILKDNLSQVKEEKVSSDSWDFTDKVSKFIHGNHNKHTVLAVKTEKLTDDIYKVELRVQGKGITLDNKVKSNLIQPFRLIFDFKNEKTEIIRKDTYECFTKFSLDVNKVLDIVFAIYDLTNKNY